jgi:mRNA-degrading endonuclease RelE of RelBE toxin-antitoxin system
MEKTQSRYARRYDREFKENAVALVESGKEVKEVARDLGVSHWSLKSWLKQSKAGKDQTQVGTLEGESFLQRELEGFHRLRVGSHRVIFDYNRIDGEQIITCVYAGPRKWIYEVFHSKLREAES